MTRGHVDLVLRPASAFRPRAGPKGGSIHSTVSATVQQHPRMPGADRGRRRAVGRDLQAQHRREDPFFGAFGVQYRSSCGIRSATSMPANVSVRQAIRNAAPSAASSGPWPATSPIRTCVTRSGVCTTS